jgi:hypothetical protein
MDGRCAGVSLGTGNAEKGGRRGTEGCLRYIFGATMPKQRGGTMMLRLRRACGWDVASVYEVMEEWMPTGEWSRGADVFWAGDIECCTRYDVQR